MTANWDFDDAFSNGNSLKITGSLPTSQPVDLMLYKTKLSIPDGVFKFDIFYKNINNNDPKMKLLVVFADDVTQRLEFPFTGHIALDNNWAWGEITIPLEYSNREIAMIGFRFETDEAIASYSINLGGLYINNTVLSVDNHSKNSAFVTVSYPETNNILFTIRLKNHTKRTFFSHIFNRTIHFL